MNTNFFKIRDYHIVDDHGKLADACAQFMYKGYMISMSTVGITKGACHSEVLVLTVPDFEYVKDGKFHTVQEAIEFVDKLTEKEKENVTAQH